MKQFKKTSVPPDARTELHDLLCLTGAEISVNHLPAGTGVPFVHAHKNNEEIYGVFAGRGAPSLMGRRWSLPPATGFGSPPRRSAGFPLRRTAPSLLSASR